MSVNRPSSFLFQELTREEIGRWAPEATAVLPVAAIEQHGPHLPVDVDRLLMEKIAYAAGKIAAKRIPMLLCPVIAYGASEHHLIYPGTMSLSTDTLLKMLKELTDSLVSSGFRRIYLLNGHGGNEEVVRLAARELALRHPVASAAASYWTVAWSDLENSGMTSDLGLVPGHAGGFETSLMMALQPETVREDLLPLPELPVHAQNQASKSISDPSSGPLIQRHGSWKANDGYSDTAGKVNAEKGKQLLQIIAEKVANELERFHNISLP